MESEAGTSKELFACTLCGDCCQGYGGTYLSAADMEAIPRYLGIAVDHFVAQYTCRSGSRSMLVQGDNGYCIFWDRVCTIHPVKPRMCRQWPFIRSVLTDVTNWRVMAASCPGMNADATDREILACVHDQLMEEPPSVE